MLGLPIAFAAPAVLAALALLAGLYFLLRVTPPSPRAIIFPPLRLLLGVDLKETTPHKTPWPILALRLAIASAIILAMAGPLWNSLIAASGQGALLVLIDDGWPAAAAWDKRIAFARQAIDSASRAGRLIALAPFSQGGVEITAGDGAHAEERMRALTPLAYVSQREAMAPGIAHFLDRNPKTQVLWIADGVDLGGADAIAAKLAATSAASVDVVTDATGVRALDGVDSSAGALGVRLVRSDASAPAAGVVKALDGQGREVGQATFDFGANLSTTARFELPVEMRNDIARIVLGDERTAGATWLVDERSRRRRVAIASGASADTAQPLLSPSYYIKRSLSPFADVREWRDSASDPVLSLLAEKPSVLALADMSVAPGAQHDAIASFVDGGGVLLRFAGTRLAAGDDDLTPTALRRGGRLLGGALSWETPKHIAPFENSSPFFGLPAPDEVTVSRQVLAEPEPGLAEKTWARLADGTPLVTAARRGKGLIVLFHASADTTWSNLPLSGLFVDMLRRVVAQAGAPAPDAAASGAPARGAKHSPWRLLDGFGALAAPGPNAQPIGDDFSGAGDAVHPPGFYGAPEALIAVNALAPEAELRRADYSGLKLREGGLTISPPLDLKPWLLAAAVVGFFIDALAALWLAGPRSNRRVRALAAIAVAVAASSLFAALPPPARAAETAPIGARDQSAALTTRLAYVATGDTGVDETSRLGLASLTRALASRTSAELDEPVAVDPARDELSFYPLIYWPIVATRPQPQSQARARIAAYMANGGTMIFDTRDALNSRPNGPPTREGLWLRALLAGVDVPELEPVPRDHVLTKTFYLLDRIVGRSAIGQTWIEALPPLDAGGASPRPARAGDSVSPIIIASDDLAGAWAEDATGQPLFPLIPGGARQRELALRSGINLVMYTLTGNYKADQVHARDILERLSH